MKKIGLLVLALVFALGSLGVGYAMWDKTLEVTGTVNTGEVNAIFTTATCNDTGIDPGYLMDGTTPKDKDVGSCSVVGAGTQLLTITVENGYPCYECDIDFTVDNTGSIPVKIQTLGLVGVPPEITVTWTGLAVGDQIGPAGSIDDELPGDLHIHVEQIADELQTGVYTFSASIYLVQWNEYQ